MAQLVEREKAVSPQVEHYLAEFRRSLEQGTPQPRWVIQARESAIARFERLGFPTTKLEQWRFTSVAPIAERTFVLADVPAGADRADTRPLSAPVAHAVCVNGRLSPRLSNLNTLPEGVQISGLEAALASNPGAARALSGQAHAETDQRLHLAEQRLSARWHRHLGREGRCRGTAHRSDICLGRRQVCDGVTPQAPHRCRRSVADYGARAIRR